MELHQNLKLLPPQFEPEMLMLVVFVQRTSVRLFGLLCRLPVTFVTWRKSTERSGISGAEAGLTIEGREDFLREKMDILCL